MTIKVINEYYNKRGAYMGEKNAETEKKAEKYGWTLYTKTVTMLDPEEGFAEDREMAKGSLKAAELETVRNW